jgi:hypothetical protein
LFDRSPVPRLWQRPHSDRPQEFDGWIADDPPAAGGDLHDLSPIVCQIDINLTVGHGRADVHFGAFASSSRDCL